MEYGKYTVTIIRKSTYASDNVLIADYKSLRIVDILHGIGSWSLTSITQERCPFTDGDFIKVDRNGICIFGGVLTEIMEEYSAKKKAWEWTASGKSMNQLLKWKTVFPPFNTTYRRLDREYTTEDYPHWLIRYLINNNASFSGSDSYNRGLYGFYVVGGAYDVMPAATEGDRVTVNYRFDNLFDSVVSLANQQDLVVIPAWRKDDDAYRIYYCITLGSDLSDTVVFNSAADQITTFKRHYYCPDATDIIMNYNAEDEYQSRPIWGYVGLGTIPVSESWRDVHQVREQVVKPKKEEFNDVFSSTRIQEICSQYVSGKTAETESFDVEINVLESPYTYGYEFESSEQFSTDYRLGDKIGIVVNGEKFTGRLEQIEFESSYGKETIRPTIGGITRGSFKSIWTNLRNLNQSTTNSDISEVS